MRLLHRRASWTLALLLVVAGYGCATEPAERNRPQDPVASLTVRYVVRLVEAGVAEDAIMTLVRGVDIEARPTGAEILALMKAGASDHLIATLLASSALLPDARPAPAWEYPVYYWPIVPPVPGLAPVTAVYLHQAGWLLWFRRVEPPT